MNPLEQQILQDTDRCVLCGMCLPHCPTYLLTRDESESPRGRIALLQAITKGLLPPSPSAAAYIDHCLGCRACEAMCPSEVPYGRIITNAKQLLVTGHRRPLRHLMLDAVSRGWPARLGRIYQRSGLQRLVSAVGVLRRFPHLERLERLLPPLPRPKTFPGSSPACGAEKGRVSLFTGCTQNMDVETLDAAIRLLNLAGFTVEIPSKQGCCGALHQNAGETERFRTLARNNLKAFAQEQDQPILFVASGCGAMLKNYDTWLAEPAAQRFSTRVREVTDFLADHFDPEAIPLDPLNEAVAVHVPCSQSNVLKKADAARRLLHHIPGIRTVEMPRGCCGAAGSYVLRYPETADALRAPHLAVVEESGAACVASTNIGCALHLAAGLRKDGRSIEVLHPVALLSRQIKKT